MKEFLFQHNWAVGNHVQVISAWPLGCGDDKFSVGESDLQVKRVLAV